MIKLHNNYSTAINMKLYENKIYRSHKTYIQPRRKHVKLHIQIVDIVFTLSSVASQSQRARLLFIILTHYIDKLQNSTGRIVFFSIFYLKDEREEIKR